MNPREQIAAVIDEHALYEYAWGVDGDCICGFRTPKSYDFAAHTRHVADAVVEALGLTEEAEWTTEKLDALPHGPVVMTASPRLMPSVSLWIRHSDDADGAWWAIGSDDSFQSKDLLYLDPEVVNLLYKPGFRTWVSGWSVVGGEPSE